MRFGWHLLPNILTFLRIVLTVPFAMALYYQHFWSALTLFFVAGFSDGVDGFLARHFNWRSRFGAIADPLADKFLLVSAYLTLSLTGVFPWWLFFLVIGRDLVIITGALVYHFWVGRYEMRPSWLGKLNTFTQIIVVLVMILSLAGIPMPSWAGPWGIDLVALLAVASGLHYFLLWGARAWRSLR